MSKIFMMCIKQNNLLSTPQRFNMTSKNMATLYQIINKEYGRSEARKTVEAMISNVIFDLQQEGKEVSSENLDLGI